MFKNGNYPVVKAEDVCEFITKGTTPKSDEIYIKAFDDCIPYLKVYNLSFTGEMLFWDEPQYISREVHEGKLARSKVYPGDEPVVYSGFCIRYRKEREELLTDYLLRFFKTDSVRAKMAGRGANIQNLNQQILAALNIQIPPIEMQKEFSVFVKQSDKSK